MFKVPRSMKMKPTLFLDSQGLELELICRHGEVWPPIQALLDETPLELMETGLITRTKYLQVQTWERVCGLTKMAEKCKACPAAMVKGEVKGKARLVPFNSALSSAPPLYRLSIKKGVSKKVLRTTKK